MAHPPPKWKYEIQIGTLVIKAYTIHKVLEIVEQKCWLYNERGQDLDLTLRKRKNVTS